MVSKGATCSKRNRCCYRKRKWSRCGSFVSALLPNTFLPAHWHKNLQFSREAETASTICVHRDRNAAVVHLRLAWWHHHPISCCQSAWLVADSWHHHAVVRSNSEKELHIATCSLSIPHGVMPFFWAPVAILYNIKHAPVIFFFLIVRHVKNNVTIEQH